MRKKIFIVILVLIFIIFILWAGFVSINNYMEQKNIETKNNSNLNTLDVENIAENTLVEEASVEEQEIEKMRAEGIPSEFFDSVVIVHDKIYNFTKLDNFVNRVKDKNLEGLENEAEIKIVIYTTEGDPIIETVSLKKLGNTELEIVNNSKIIITTDSTRDRYAAEKTVSSTEYSWLDYKLVRKYKKDEMGREVINIVLQKNNADDVQICGYLLSETDYKRNIEINFNGRKDMGIDTILEKNTLENQDFNIYTIGGNVNIVLEGDMVYSLADALKNKVITIEDILSQAQTDIEYGVCTDGEYSDGGSVEYDYEGYTLVKYNNLSGRKDLVFAPEWTILSDITKILEEQKL